MCGGVPLVRLPYSIPINTRTYKYLVLTPLLYYTYMTLGMYLLIYYYTTPAAYHMHIYLHNTTRVDVHIACIRKNGGVGVLITRTRIYTSIGIYKYICILDRNIHMYEYGTKIKSINKRIYS